HLAERGITVGIGAGSATSDMIRKRSRVSMLREMILFLKEMFAGRKVNLGDFPRLTDRLDPAAQGLLRLPPLKPPDIFVAAAGPQTLKIAGELGDGLILSNLSFPTALVRQGALADAMNKLSAARASREDRRFTKVLHLHVSVSRDGKGARRYCRGMATNGLIQGHLLRQRLLQLPVPAETLAVIQNAHRQSRTVEEMDALISDQVIDDSGIVIAGTPAACINQLDQILRAAKPYRFD